MPWDSIDVWRDEDCWPKPGDEDHVSQWDGTLLDGLEDEPDA